MRSAAVRRVGTLKGPGHGEGLGEPALQAECPEAQVGLLGRTGSSRCQNHTAAVGSPPPNPINPRVIGKSFGITPSDRYDVDVRVACNRGGEGYLGIIR